MATFTELLATLDSDPRRRGKQFERVCAWFLRNAPEYRDQLSDVWLWNEWPGRWDSDAGIDLVARTTDGALWAIQAKAYALGASVTKADVDSFLSESARAAFSFRLLVATTNCLSRHARRVAAEQEKPVSWLLLHQLTSSALSWPSSIAALGGAHTATPTPDEPLPHQSEAVDACVAGLQNHTQGQLIMACGTGKTNVGLWISERLASTRTLVLLPSLSLLSQTLRSWTRNRTAPFQYLAVCSDETIARGEDAAVLNPAELGVQVTTAPQHISAFLSQRTRQVIFATYHSSPQIAAAQGDPATPAFDLVIADEAHRCAGPNNGDYTTVLDGDRLRARRRLFMTATPRYFTDRVKRAAEDANYDVASMDDPVRFGPVLHSLSFSEAIHRELLSDYRVAVVGVTDAELADAVRRAAFVTRDGERVTTARSLAAHVGFAKAMQQFDLRAAVTFHSRVRSAEQFTRELPGVIAWMPSDSRPSGEIWARHVHGEMPAGERELLLDTLRAEDPSTRRVLANARCLSEGVDIPDLDGIAFIDPKGSQVDIVQAVGRAIRKRRDGASKIGTIIVPVFVDTTTEPSVALDGSCFEPVWAVLKALRAHDGVLAERLDELRRHVGLGGVGARLPSKIALLVPDAVSERFAAAFEARVVKESTASWEEWFGALERFVASAGHARVPAKHVCGAYALGGWVSDQRKLNRRGLLSPRRAARLSALSGWVWDAQAAEFERGFSALEAFVSRERHAHVPQKHVENGFLLGRWVSELRKRRATLPADRVRRLAELPGWAWDSGTHAWERAFEVLRAYVADHGNARVPQGCRAAGFNLGAWVNNQRNAKRDNRLDDERISRLEALSGWTWDPRAAQWEDAVEMLREYVTREADAHVPVAYRVGAFKLGQWVSSARRAYRRGTLTPDQVRVLEQLAGWTWRAYDKQWKIGREQLLAFVSRTGTARVPVGITVAGFKLGNWVARQRRNYKNGKLTADDIAWFERLPGWEWSPSSARLRRTG